MNIEFKKMHGIGNDFVVIDNFNGRIKLSKDQVAYLCDRHKGVGADGVILVEASSEVDCFMNYINADGSEAQMCGNGIRCVAKFLKDDYLKSKNIFKIATRGGVKEVISDGSNSFSVNMGKPIFISDDFPNFSENVLFEGLTLHCVSMGNPHAVVFVEDLNKYDLLALGPKIENNKNFPNKINFELVEKISSGELKVKVWERGCGATLACGTGACAVYAISRKYENTLKEVVIHLPGGKLFVLEKENGEIIMKGEAKSVYFGLIEI